MAADAIKGSKMVLFIAAKPKISLCSESVDYLMPHNFTHPPTHVVCLPLVTSSRGGGCSSSSRGNVTAIRSISSSINISISSCSSSSISS